MGRAALTSLIFGLALVTALGLSTPLVAQDNVIVVPLDPIDPGEVIPGEPLPEDENTVAPIEGSVIGEEVITVEEDKVARGTGAKLRALDKLAGTVEELTLRSGETVAVGWLQVTLAECRYPVNNPAGDGYGWLVIREKAGEAPIFEGWMVASSPALNALDHSRYDVWVSQCTTE